MNLRVAKNCVLSYCDQRTSPYSQEEATHAHCSVYYVMGWYGIGWWGLVKCGMKWYCIWVAKCIWLAWLVGMVWYVHDKNKLGLLHLAISIMGHGARKFMH